MPRFETPPTPQNFSSHEEAWFKEGEAGNWETLFVNQAKALGQEISSIVKAIDPERTAALEAEEAIEAELSGRIEQTEELGLGGLSKPLDVTFKDSRLSAVYKPIAREKTVAKSYEIKEGTLAQREWLVYQINKALGLHVVPPTVLRQGSSGLGSMQQWKTGFQIGNVPDWKKKAVKNDLAAISLLDRSTDNQDRNPGNMLLDEEGHLWAIDNAVAFSYGFIDDNCSLAVSEGHGLAPSPDITSNIQMFLSSAELQATLQKAFAFALGKDWKKAWKKFQTVLEATASRTEL